MEPLKSQVPTPEQRALFTDTRPMMRVVRGAAGSGKTTIALLMLKIAIRLLKARRSRIKDEVPPIRAVVFTFNRTLSSYIRDLAQEIGQDVDVEVTTLAKYCRNKYPNIESYTIINNFESSGFKPMLKNEIGLSIDFLHDEIGYILGRFHPDRVEEYILAQRIGRGISPRVDRDLRRIILDEIITPYMEYKKKNNMLDWNDIISYVADNCVDSIDILVTDESQDFSANELRSIVKQSNKDTFGTFVIDTAQRIYNRGFTWKEVGLNIRPENSFTLENNYRNTVEIAEFASCVLEKLPLDNDGTIPNLHGCSRSGDLPIVIEGFYNEQVKFAIDYIYENVDLTQKTVAFLSRKGGGVFSYLRGQLRTNGLDFCEITKAGEWPRTTANIALSTMHSAKGLEFDYVFMIGLSSEFLHYDEDVNSESYINICKLVGMSITRAKACVVVGYKKEEKPSLIDLFPSDKFEFERL